MEIFNILKTFIDNRRNKTGVNNQLARVDGLAHSSELGVEFFTEDIKKKNEELRQKLTEAKAMLTSEEGQKTAKELQLELEDTLQRIIEDNQDKKIVVVVGGKSKMLIKAFLGNFLKSSEQQADRQVDIVQLGDEDNKKSYLGWWGDKAFGLSLIEVVDKNLEKDKNNYIVGIDDHGTSFGKAHGFLTSCEK